MTESEKEFLQRDLLHKMDQLIDQLCKEVGDNKLTANEIRIWFIPTVNKLHEARRFISVLTMPTFKAEVVHETSNK